MDPRQLRALSLLGGILTVLVGLYLFSPTEVADDARIEVVEPFSYDEPVSVVLQRHIADREDRIVLTKREGIWWVTEPFEAPADPDLVFGVIDAIAGVARGRPLRAEERADFGLEPATIVAEITLASGAQRRLILGDRAPVGLQTYALVDDTVVAVDGHPADELSKRAQEYRDHKIFQYDPAEVIRVSVESALGLLEATKTPAGWFLTGFSRADLNALDDWIVDLTRLRVDLFLDLDHETIEAPRFRVQVETSSGVQEMLVGRDTPYGPLVFFKDGLDGVVAPELLAMLERGPTDVGVSAVFPFSDEHTTSITLSGETEHLLEPPWVMEDPRIQVVQNAQFTYRREAPPWTSTELVVVLEGPEPHTFEIGPVDRDGFRPVRDRGGGSAMRVPAEELAGLF